MVASTFFANAIDYRMDPEVSRQLFTTERGLPADAAGDDNQMREIFASPELLWKDVSQDLRLQELDAVPQWRDQ